MCVILKNEGYHERLSCAYYSYFLSAFGYKFVSSSLLEKNKNTWKIKEYKNLVMEVYLSLSLSLSLIKTRFLAEAYESKEVVPKYHGFLNGTFVWNDF